MGSIFKAPKMPDPAPIQMPKVEDVPEVDNQELEEAEDKDLKTVQRKRKGRRSTILTGTGLNEIDDENIQKKTLLG